MQRGRENEAATLSVRKKVKIVAGNKIISPNWHCVGQSAEGPARKATPTSGAYILLQSTPPVRHGAHVRSLAPSYYSA